MILRHKQSRKLYNLIGIETDGRELSLKLAYWFKTQKGAYKKATRTATTNSWGQLIEHMEKFEEEGIGEITANNVKEWLNEEAE